MKSLVIAASISKHSLQARHRRIVQNMFWRYIVSMWWPVGHGVEKTSTSPRRLLSFCLDQDGVWMKSLFMREKVDELHLGPVQFKVPLVIRRIWMYGLWGQTALVWILAQPLRRFMTMGKLLNPSVPQFSFLTNKMGIVALNLIE